VPSACASQEEAFVVAPDAVSAPKIDPRPDYIDSSVFSGEMQGYVFKFDQYGVGYYRDDAGLVSS